MIPPPDYDSEYDDDCRLTPGEWLLYVILGFIYLPFLALAGAWMAWRGKQP